MIQVRKSNDRGQANHGWLNSKHTFSFANYYDPQNMGFRDLRVINEDHVSPGKGFPTHPHRDMEIITYVISGALEHKDSMGTGSVIRPGEVQRMSAGTGITHSEFNASQEELVHLLQIWILPDQARHTPSYAQKDFSSQLGNELTLVASAAGRLGSISIHQDAELFVSRPTEGTLLTHSFKAERHGWIQIVKGNLSLLTKGSAEENPITLKDGDGAAISQIQTLQISAHKDSEFLLFDLA